MVHVHENLLRVLTTGMHVLSKFQNLAEQKTHKSCQDFSDHIQISVSHKSWLELISKGSCSQNKKI